MSAGPSITAPRVFSRPTSARGRPATPGLRDRILAAAIRVFAGRAFHLVRMDDVAVAAGVAKGTVYRYFPTKDELYLATVFQVLDQLHEKLRHVAEATPDPLQRLRAVTTELLASFWGREVFFLLLHRNEERGGTPKIRAWLARRQRFAQLMAMVLQEGIDAGLIRPVDVRVATEALLGMLRGVHRYRAPRDTPAEVAAQVLDVFLHGVRAAVAAGRNRR